MAWTVLVGGVTVPRWPLVLPVLTLLASTDAWALQPAKHRQLAERACADADLPPAFCRRMGKAVFETDYEEWKDLSAHAQRLLDQDRCSAADAAVDRVDRLAREAVAKTTSGQFADGAIALGRALHTLQDECAHHGMTNEEHAFYSLEQSCTDAETSPDVQPEALACAESRTRDVMSAVATALAGTHWTSVESICIGYDTNTGRDQDSCAQAVLPTPLMACRFLRQHEDWDGQDSRWNADIVGPALVSAFKAGLANEPASRSVCAGDMAAIDPPAAHAPVTDLDVGCLWLDFTCLGKVDDGGADSMDSTESAGCNAGAGSPGLVLAAAALFGRRRRRRR
ncbi:MAG TPA: hypothetical protein VLB44_09630 [Kofleriaceae bacterium]|nr:hypothetical protein [Kofleriaceae bacterium]